MARIFYIIVGIACCLVHLASAKAAGKTMNTKGCPRGCRDDSDCLLHTECRFVDENGPGCGVCVCPMEKGYRKVGQLCKESKGKTTTELPTAKKVTAAAKKVPTTDSETTETTAPTEKQAEDNVKITTAATEAPTSPTTIPTTEATTEATTEGTTSQGPPPTSYEPIECGAYDCSAGPDIQSKDDNPLQVRSAVVKDTDINKGCKRQLFVQPRPCSIVGGGSCYGSYCLTVSAGNDYCICSYDRVDRQCAVEKKGSCSQASGQPPSGMTKLDGRRLVNPQNPHHGSVYGRHFASDLTACIKLCQWTQGLCKSCNFGKINNVNVCELMSIAATEKNLLKSWLTNASGWQYCQVAN